MKRPLKTAAVCGLIVLILSVIVGILTMVIINSPNLATYPIVFFSYSLSLLGLYFCCIFFMYGFIVLARKFDANLLKVMAWIGFVGSILFFALLFISTLSSLIQSASAQETALPPGFSEDELGQLLALAVGVFIILWFFLVLAGVYAILFGAGLLKLKEVEFSKPAGILNIISGALCITFIGVFVVPFVYLVALIFQVMMLFRAAQKYEKAGPKRPAKKK